MSVRRLILPAALLALAASPAFAQDPPDPPEAAPPPRAVERAERSRARADGEPRAPRAAERVALPEARPRVRVDAPDAAPAAPAAPAFEEQGGRRRPSGGGGGRSAGGGGRVSGGGGSRGEGGAVARGGVRNPNVDGRGGEVAQAIPRSRAPRPPANWGNSYGRRYYAGPGGLGYYFYDPWSWYGWGWPAYGAYGAYGWGGFGNAWGGYYGGGYGAYGGPYGWSIGGVRLKVSQRDAEVYVDGYYAGIVDDFDGIWQQLRLDDGGYRVEIRKPGFETLVFDVRIQPGRTITYRGQMQSAP
jgi:hypothetical protein